MTNGKLGLVFINTVAKLPVTFTNIRLSTQVLFAVTSYIVFDQGLSPIGIVPRNV